MLQVIPRLSEEIIQTKRENNALLLTSHRGVLRIMPYSADAIRISYIEGAGLSDTLPPYFIERPTFHDWSHKETPESIFVKTKALTMAIDRNTGSISYEASGSILLKEQVGECRTLIPFDSYRIVADENTVVEEIETPDGKKQVIREAQSVFDRKLYHTRLHLCFSEDEALYGLGQQEEGSINLRGTTQYLHQANLKIAVPLLVSSKGYGLLPVSGSPAIFSDTAYGSYLYVEADRQMDYFFLYGGTPDGVVKNYRALTGKAPMLPRWALGYWQSQERYESGNEILEVAKSYRDLGIGLDALVLDWQYWPDKQWGQKEFDATRFPNPGAMIDALHQMNIRLFISLWPNMAKQSSDHREMKEKGFLLPASDIYDAINPQARALFWQQTEDKIFRYGMDGWWCDSSEPYTPEWSHQKKPEPIDMYREFCEEASKTLPADESNAYAFYHAMAMAEGQRRTGSDKRVVNLTRSGFTGQQRFGTVLWSGDISASWDTLQKQIPAGLNLSAAGMPYWTLDAGAFFVKRGVQWFWDGDYQDGWADKGYCELALRWFQFAAFLPVFRGHGTDISRHWQELKRQDKRMYDALFQANRLRYKLVPYLYSLMGGVWLRDDLMIKPLGFAFPQDCVAYNIADQFMLGNDMLVCPVIEPMVYSRGSQRIKNQIEARQVYLPASTRWFDFYTGALYEGGQWISASAPLERIPVFMREGSILPILVSNDIQNTQQTVTAEMVIRVYTGTDASFLFYEDAGDGYAYEEGQYTLTQLEWNEQEQRLVVEEKNTGFASARDFEAMNVILIKQEESK
ncbi:MAG: TIM-barrel domain-containing protein [Christensenellales bacterium]|jgi:alpha-D-xyloside xylohydrolase